MPRFAPPFATKARIESGEVVGLRPGEEIRDELGNIYSSDVTGAFRRLGTNDALYLLGESDDYATFAAGSQSVMQDTSPDYVTVFIEVPQ